MSIVNGREPAGVPLARACDVLSLSRATVYRAMKAKPVRTRPTVRRSPRRLSDAERRVVLDVLHRPEFADQPPTEVFATMLSRGEYVASIRTMYRVLAEHGEVQERRRQRKPHTHAIPMLTATAPNQVWTWDITKLRGPEPRILFALYVIIDLFSRMVVGWLLAARESTELAKQLFAEAYKRHAVEPGSLVVHADRGAAMRSEGLAQLLAALGVDRSFSRPRVSDDNAFSEAHFKTLKYQPDYPERFGSELHARAWAQEFFGWYNEQHHHSGIALFTPSEVFHGRVDRIIAIRQHALDHAFAEHPERFPNGPPVAKRPPSKVAINPPLPADEQVALNAAHEQPTAQVAASAPGGRIDVPNLDSATTTMSVTTVPVRQPGDGAEPCGPTTLRPTRPPRRTEPRPPRRRKRGELSQPAPS